MNFLIVFALAVVGAASALPQGFLQNTPEVQQATLNFISEYNRLAKLAADAPDIDIYHDDNALQRLETGHRMQSAALPTPINSGFNIYSFSANLGTNSQFQPHQFRRFGQQPAVHRAPVHRAPVHRAPVHRASVHRAPVHRAPAPPRPRPQPNFFAATPAPVAIEAWTGPFADTIPAGVNGLPQQVTSTPDVAAARDAHYRILVDAYQQAAATRQASG